MLAAPPSLLLQPAPCLSVPQQPLRSAAAAALPSSLAVALALGAGSAGRFVRHQQCRSHRCRSTWRAVADKVAAAPSSGEIEDDGIDRTTDYSKNLPEADSLEKWENGQKWLFVKYGKIPRWVLDSEVGRYRYTERGYESRGTDGKWVNQAQMPEDVSHLTEAQRERLIRELKGEIKVSLSDGGEDDKNFIPLSKIPPLEKWPFYEVDITDDLKATPEQMKDYKELQMTEDIGRAFFLATRWKLANEARRHLGYDVNNEIDDIANMNSTVLALKSLCEQLKRISKFRRRKEEDELPSDAQRLSDLRCTGILGTEKGSAMCLWLHNPEKKRISIDVNLGDDCMFMGLYAEEILLRLMACKAAELGAEKMWVRSRRTESGKVFVPKPFRNLGFTAVALEEQGEEEWETVRNFVEREEASEAVPGLYLWITTRDLGSYLSLANTWCTDMGAADINEVAENKLELASFLEEHGLTQEERERLLRY